MSTEEEPQFRVCSAGLPRNDARLHVCIEGRYLTLFRHNGHLSAIDSICHHAGGPLTLGPLQDIEELGLTAVSCPWHKFLVSITDGKKAYQQVEIVNGVPTVKGWKIGKVVQRAHKVIEREDGVYVTLDKSEENIQSDRDACSSRCAQDYPIHSEQITRQSFT